MKRFVGPGLLALLGPLACGGPDGPGLASPACDALAAAADRGAACDPELRELARSLRARPDETACAVAVRTLLTDVAATRADDPPEPSELRSVFDATPRPDASSLTPEELEALATLERPARLVITPELGRVPGIPPTTADIDRLALDADSSGRLSTQVAPGRRTLVVRHAGASSTYCVELRACEAVEATAHASQLAKHPRVRPGPC